jgi:pimeloyl-ACP methyl ester carboxylesterase
MSPIKSTTGRSKSIPQRLAGAAVRAAGAVAPRAIAAFVADRFAAPRRARALLPEGEGLRHALRGHVDCGPYRLATYGRGAGPYVLLAHGWEGTADDMATIAGALADAGFRAVAFDMPAHGGSTGRRATLVEMTRAVTAVAESLGAPLAAVVGHSLGATAVVHALRAGLDARCVVAVAPPRRVEPYLRGFTRALGLGVRHDAAVRAAVERRVGPLDRFDADRAARAVTHPGLVVHDVADRHVPFADGVAIAEAWPGARLVPVDALGHRRVLHDPDVVRRVVGFVLEHSVADRTERAERQRRSA